MAGGFIIGIGQSPGGDFVAGAQTFLFAIYGVLGVVNAVAAIETEQFFHNITFLSAMLSGWTVLRY